jgi:MFS family permease
LIKKGKSPKIFFGWWTALTAGLLPFWAMGYYAYGISALFKPISSELGITRAMTSVAASVGRFGGGFEAPLSGWIADKYGPKWIVLFGVSLISLSLILMNFINAYWGYLVVWGIMLGTGVNVGLSVPLDKAITNWFVKKRGKALSIKWVLAGLSGVIVLPLVAWLLDAQGWRITCVIGGLVMGLVGLPLVWFCIKQKRPEYYGLLPDGATAEVETVNVDQMIDKGVKYAAEVEEVEFTLRQAVRTPAYWLILIGWSVHSLVLSAIGIHCIPFLTDIEIDPLKAASMMALMIGASIPSRLIIGLIADRFTVGSLRFLVGGAYLLQGLGFALYLLNPTMAMIYVWFIVYGIGQGGGFILNPLIRGRYFGRKAFGSIQGSAMMIAAPAGMAGPIFTGWIYDTTGSYINAFTTFVVILIITAALLPFAVPPKPPAEVTDIRKIV